MPYSLEIHQLDVAQGESALILVKQGPTGKIVKSAIIDGGEKGQYSKNIFPYVKKYFGTQKPILDLVITSHYDADHFGGICSLIEDNRLINDKTTFLDRGVPLQGGDIKSSDYREYRKNLFYFFRDYIIKEKVKSKKIKHNSELYKVFLLSGFNDLFNYFFKVKKASSSSTRSFDRVGDTAKKHSNRIDLHIKSLGKSKKRKHDDELIIAELKKLKKSFDSDFVSCFNEFKKVVAKQWPTATKVAEKYKPKKSKAKATKLEEEIYHHLNKEFFGLASGPTLTCIAMNSIGNNADKHENNNSLAFLLEFNRFRFYSGGDLESDIEDKEILTALNKGAAIAPISVFKASHHGSAHSTSSKFIHAIRPTVGLISCGSGSSYGHPRKEVLNRLTAGKRLDPLGAEKGFSPLQRVYLTEGGTKEGHDFLKSKDDFFHLAGKWIDDKKPIGHIVVSVTSADSLKLKPEFTVTLSKPGEESIIERYVGIATGTTFRKPKAAEKFPRISTSTPTKEKDEEEESESESESESEAEEYEEEAPEETPEEEDSEGWFSESDDL